jgi:hypothetical protein
VAESWGDGGVLEGREIGMLKGLQVDFAPAKGGKIVIRPDDRKTVGGTTRNEGDVKVSAGGAVERETSKRDVKPIEGEETEGSRGIKGYDNDHQREGENRGSSVKQEQHGLMLDLTDDELARPAEGREEFHTKSPTSSDLVAADDPDTSTHITSLDSQATDQRTSPPPPVSVEIISSPVSELVRALSSVSPSSQDIRASPNSKGTTSNSTKLNSPLDSPSCRHSYSRSSSPDVFAMNTVELPVLTLEGESERKDDSIRGRVKGEEQYHGKDLATQGRPRSTPEYESQRPLRDSQAPRKLSRPSSPRLKAD